MVSKFLRKIKKYLQKILQVLLANLRTFNELFTKFLI